MLNKKLKTKNILKWVIELGIWFLIFILLANVILFFKARNDRAYSTYQIFMQDVDGVIIGSPVNFMGISVGYVEKVKIIGNEVFVQFKLNKKGLKLPKGSVVTVEFSGLGGSKSLVIYPPNEDSINSDKYLIVQNPKRLGDAVSLIDEMFDKITSITYKFSYFGKRVSEIEEVKSYEKSDKTIKSQLEGFEKSIDKTILRVEKLNKSKNKRNNIKGE